MPKRDLDRHLPLSLSLSLTLSTSRFHFLTLRVIEIKICAHFDFDFRFSFCFIERVANCRQHFLSAFLASPSGSLSRSLSVASLVAYTLRTKELRSHGVYH